MRLLFVFLTLLAVPVLLFSHKIFGIDLSFPKTYSQPANIKGVTNFAQIKKLPVPIKVNQFQNPPAISEKSAIVIDTNGNILYEKDSSLRLLPASLTKLLTALTALKLCSPDQYTTVSKVENTPAQMGLAPGDTISVQSLLNGLLIASGNDAAYALATACADSTESFVTQMNDLAKTLGMNNSHFAGPAGFDDVSQFTTARDLAKLAKAAVANPTIAKIVATKSIVVNDKSGVKTYYLTNLNKLLGEVEGVKGIKTGHTEGAQENLVTQTARDNHTIICVVLGSTDRFAESKMLIEWSFANYRWTM